MKYLKYQEALIPLSQLLIIYHEYHDPNAVIGRLKCIKQAINIKLKLESCRYKLNPDYEDEFTIKIRYFETQKDLYDYFKALENFLASSNYTFFEIKYKDNSVRPCFKMF